LFFFCPYVRMSICNKTPAHRLVHDMALSRQNIGYRKYSTLINHPPCSYRLACAYHPSHSFTGLWDRVIPHRACQDSRTSVLLMLHLLWISLVWRAKTRTATNPTPVPMLVSWLVACPYAVWNMSFAKEKNPQYLHWCWFMLQRPNISEAYACKCPDFKINLSKQYWCCYNGEFRCKRQHIMFLDLDMHVKTCKRVFQCPYV
jgi:hypothetical protein